VEPGLDRLIHTPDTSSTEHNPTGIAHHAHKPTEETLQELPLTLAPTSTSSTSSTGNHQPGLRNTRESQ